ncbi:hypothetical protein CGT95_18070 [Vibrio metoecus]|nr:hypothetical protein CGT95_18070 [Vibrio metoecus]
MDIRYRTNKKQSYQDKMYSLEVSKLQIDYGKFMATLYTAAAGGQITLLGTFFNSALDKYLAYASIGLMLSAVITSYSFAEMELRAIKQDEIDSAFPRWAKFRKKLPSKIKIEFYKSLYLTATVATSVVLYFLFLITNEQVAL